MRQCVHTHIGSGGAGQFRGGDGVIREMMFRQPLTVSILSERRAFEPYGMQGGCNGARGQVNTLSLDKAYTFDFTQHELYCSVVWLSH
jgi:N-methylhydantoinase B/oxoprolinase/acetone carboxylase alpha subunit